MPTLSKESQHLTLLHFKHDSCLTFSTKKIGPVIPRYSPKRGKLKFKKRKRQCKKCMSALRV